MRTFVSFLLILVAISSAFGWHLDEKGDPRDLNEVISPIANVVESVSLKARELMSYILTSQADYIDEESSVYHLYEPFLSEGGWVSFEISHIEVYLYSIEIKTSGDYHSCYVLYASTGKRGRSSPPRYFVVQDLDKSSSHNLEGWYFEWQIGGLLFDREGASNLPWRKGKDLEASTYTLATLPGQYWTPEGMVTNP